ACLVLVDGNPKTSCAVPAKAAAGKTVLTLEGVPEEERRLYGEAFAKTAGLQCGFCIPGIALRMKSVLDADPDPSDEEIRRKLDPHLCRCTGYIKIFEAFHAAARLRRGERLPDGDGSGRVGTSLDRYEAEDLALGTRPYVADLTFPGMLHGAVVLSAHARARVKKIGTARAAAHPGVAAVVTAKDVPGKRFYGLIVDDWPGFVAEGEETHCVGDVLAAVAAVDARTAREAAESIEVEYEVLPPVTDPEKALEEGAPSVGPQGNLLSRSVIRRGDAESALASSAHVVEGTWQTQRIEHLYLEPEACAAVPGDATGDYPGARLTLYTQGQGVFDDHRQVAAFCSLPEDGLHVVLVPNGGAFGGKEDMSIQAQTALLALKTRRPVRLVLSREESMRVHPKRHPIKMRYRVGCDENGRLTAVHARMIGDSGAYASVGMKVLERAAGHAAGPYRCDNVDIEALAVYTNNPPCGAMRGFGANQAHFAIEGAMDLLAEKAGLDGWEIRWRNALEAGDDWSCGQRLDASVGLKKTLLAVKDAYYANPGRAGIACGIKNCGIGNGAREWGRARLVVEEGGAVTLYNGYTEMGQGLLTVLIQFACEVTGLPPSVFRARVDTRFPMAVGQTTGSRATFFGGRAVMDAARKLKADLDSGRSLEELAGNVYVGEVLQDDTVALGHEPPPGKPMKLHPAFSFATQVAVVDETGRVAKVVAAHDVGRAVNPKLCEGQIEGSVHMGLGYALSEEMLCVDGMPVTFRLRDYGVLRSRDMPEVEVVLVEDPQPDGPFGAKGVGEIGLVPTAPAVAGALYAFDGIRRFTLPMKDSPAARALKR
ncbi:MAG TPA: selenium-dependent xanthine dehydrogenase, partial [Thermoanaerobaculia bacterium]|nr:selenium-dependent xanthine dehydrogenase [Thermoanaerobaculia bacterium]